MIVGGRVSNGPAERAGAVLVAAALVLGLVAGACSKSPPPPKSVASAPPVSSPSPAADPVAATDEEPPEEALRKLKFDEYAAIEKQGGLPVEVSQTGQQLTLRPKLYEVHKVNCFPQPQRPPGFWECHLKVLLSLSPDGKDPSEQGERIRVKRGPNGDWVPDR